jgi:hypothetical protein
MMIRQELFEFVCIFFGLMFVFLLPWIAAPLLKMFWWCVQKIASLFETVLVQVFDLRGIINMSQGGDTHDKKRNQQRSSRRSTRL